MAGRRSRNHTHYFSRERETIQSLWLSDLPEQVGRSDLKHSFQCTFAGLFLLSTQCKRLAALSHIWVVALTMVSVPCWMSNYRDRFFCFCISGALREQGPTLSAIFYVQLWLDDGNLTPPSFLMPLNLLENLPLLLIVSQRSSYEMWPWRIRCAIGF